MKIPNKLTPNPIITTAVEIRFEAGEDDEVVIGAIYKSLGDKFSRYNPISIPNELRKQVKEFKYSPVIELSEDKYIVRIGYNIISFQTKERGYLSWEHFSTNLDNIIQSISSFKVKKIERIGLRYVNFFPNVDDAASILNFNIDFNNIPHVIDKKSCKFLMFLEDLKFTLAIADGAAPKDYKNTGAIIDIDVFSDTNTNMDVDKIKTVINRLHDEEKNLFFTLLKQEIIQKFNPQYSGGVL